MIRAKEEKRRRRRRRKEGGKNQEGQTGKRGERRLKSNGMKDGMDG